MSVYRPLGPHVRGLTRKSLFPGGGAIPEPYINLEDRIPIHISDVSQFGGGCRRRWDWSSPLRRGLQPGILPPPLQLGQAVHYAMKMGYIKTLGTGQPMQFDMDAALDGFYEIMGKRKQIIIRHLGPMWEDEEQEFTDMERMGATLIVHYSLYIPPLDKMYRLWAAEKKFRVALPGERRICYEGYLDGIVEDVHNDLWVLEYKTARSLSNTSGTFRSMQATMYTWAASIIYDRPVRGVLYRVLRKRAPDIPKLTTQGKFSRNKTQQITMCWARYCIDKIAHKLACTVPEGEDQLPIEEVEKRAKLHLASLNIAAEGLFDMIRGSDKKFFIHKKISRNQTQMDHAIMAVKTMGNMMIKKNLIIYPITGWNCSFCPFKSPCDLMEFGEYQAAEDMLRVEYAPRKYWEDLDAIEIKADTT